MSQSLRQSELFAGADWKVLYEAFTQVNFNASDPPSIATAMRAYINNNYPETFNDWIESSEFVAIIELLAWLGGTLAFKTDINARECFLETAETRNSILRLARFLSYNPKRNNCSQGMLKIMEVMTDDDVFDAYGNNLNNTSIKWNDPDDADWFDKFTLVLNSTFTSTNNFGIPLKSGFVGDVKTQLYRLNNMMSEQNLNWSTSVAGTTMPFDIVNADFEDGAGIFEREPLPTNALHMIYRNDGTGNASTDTGFFFMFKQGTLTNALYNIANPVENQLIDISASNVNETDVWVQTVDNTGATTISWDKVPAIFTQNITYNNFDQILRNIYSVITKDNDAISIRFSDGRFGSVPVGNIRVWYRTSNGLQYQIKPTDISRKKLTIPYYNRRGVKKKLTVVLSLQASVYNATARETDAQIQARAPSVYATQNRMVSGEDYNTFPLQSNLAVKLKAVNRVYSGHSRYIDLNDPTGNYQDVNVFADDGIVFKEKYNIQTQVPISSNSSDSEILLNYISPILERSEVGNYVRGELLLNKKTAFSPPIIWNRSTGSTFSSTGYFTGSDDFISKGASILFSDGSWATIASIDVNSDAYTAPIGAGNVGPVALSYNIPDQATIVEIIPAYLNSFSSSASDDILAQLAAKNSFVVSFNYNTSEWIIGTDANAVKVLEVNYYSGVVWTISAMGERFVFESDNHVQWYNDGKKAYDTNTGIAQKDLIKIQKTNENIKGGTGRGFSSDQVWNIDRLYLNRDGSANPRRITVTMVDDNLNGFPDSPEIFEGILDTNIMNTYLFWVYDATYGMVPFSGAVVAFENESDRTSVFGNQLTTGTVAFQITSTSGNQDNTFWVKTDSGWAFQRGVYSYGIGRGYNTAAYWVEEDATIGWTVTNPVTDNPWSVLSSPANLTFQWKHYAPTDHRIDPSKTNIVDMFVLTTEYDYLVRQWLKDGAIPADLPSPVTDLDLRLAFTDYEAYKMFSDGVVWRPVKYKMLFGNGAADELKGQFKVVKMPNSTLSDGEIASKLIKAVNNYFDVNLWDFGDTFYFTELSAYIHQQLANIVASVVLVPSSDNANFGDGYEVRSRSDQIFISTAQVSDVVIINSNTPTALKIR